MSTLPKPLVVNLFGGSGCGKSTGAAYIFSQLKLRDINCELVTEYAKDKTWEGNRTALNNQAYVFGKQYYRISRLHGKVDIVITDSPLLLSIVYNNNPDLGYCFNESVFKIFNSYTNLNYFLKRVKKFDPVGRWETEEEAKAIDVKVKEILDKYGLIYQKKKGDISGYNEIIEEVVNCYKSLKILNGSY